MNRSLPIKTAAAILLLAATACAAHEVFPVVHNEPVTVRVLDGMNGQPQPYAHVVLVAGYDRRDLGLGLFREEAITDGAGAVHLSNQLRNLPLVRVEVLKRHACQPDAGDAAFSVELIRRDGLSGANRCGTATVEDAPGVLTFFVKSKKGTPPADGSNAPLTVAAVSMPDPGSTPAAHPDSAPVPLPAPVSAPASQEPAAPSSAAKSQLAAEPDSAPALPPIPYAAVSAVDPIAGSTPETVSLPAPPSVITQRQAPRPRHASPSADPQLRLAPAQGPGPRPMSSKPSAAHVLSPQPHRLPAPRAQSAEAASVAPALAPAPSLHPVPPSASAASPAPLPQSAPMGAPDDAGVDPLCVPAVE